MTEKTPGFEEHQPQPPPQQPQAQPQPQPQPQQAQPQQPQPQPQPQPQAQPQPEAAPGPAPEENEPQAAAAPQQEQEAPQAAETDQVAALTAQLDQVRSALAERTADLQRLQAEYQNYRRRVERDRGAVREMAVANLLSELLPVLDDIGRARDHNELVGGFKSVAESLETTVAKMGLQQYGKEGEPFDPTVHEALMHSYAPDVTETTCVAILQPGYRIGERIIRPARVAVAEPQPGAQTAKPAEESGTAQAAEQQGEDKENGGPEEG